MISSIKPFLKKFPGLYYLLQRIYYAFRKIVEIHILGTKIQEWAWRRHGFRTSSYLEKYYETISHPHRHLLVEKISSYTPFENILEIGCSAGANLYLLAKKFPSAKIYGVDINSQAVEKGKVWLGQKGITNISLSIGKVDKLNQFDDKNIDIVFTDSTLIYIGLDKIKKVIMGMGRIARKALIFYEWNFNDNSKSYLWYDGHWIYNYKVLLAEYFPYKSVKILKSPKDLWNDKNWGKFGSIIEVKL